MDGKHLDYLASNYKEAPAPKKFAVIDPNWGEPLPILETISDSKVDAISRALMLEDLSLYSGAIFYAAGMTEGKWEKLARHGFTVSEIEIKIIK